MPPKGSRRIHSRAPGPPTKRTASAESSSNPPKEKRMATAKKRDEMTGAPEESLEQDRRDGNIVMQLTQAATNKSVEHENFLTLCNSKTIMQGWKHADCTCKAAVKLRDANGTAKHWVCNDCKTICHGSGQQAYTNHKKVCAPVVPPTPKPESKMNSVLNDVLQENANRILTLDDRRINSHSKSNREPSDAQAPAELKKEMLLIVESLTLVAQAFAEETQMEPRRQSPKRRKMWRYPPPVVRWCDVE